MDDADTPWWIQRAWLSGRNGEELTSLGHGCGLVGRHCETFVKEKQQLDGLPHLFFCWLLLVAFFFSLGFFWWPWKTGGTLRGYRRALLDQVIRALSGEGSW